MGYVGLKEGNEVGIRLGFTEGRSGAFVGTTVKAIDGIKVGVQGKFENGLDEDIKEGAIVGLMEGIKLGLAVWNEGLTDG